MLQSIARVEDKAVKSILVPIEDCPSVNAQLAAALCVSRQFDSHIDGIAPFNAIDSFAIGDGAVGVSTATIQSFERDQKDSTDKAQKIFREFMRNNEMDWGDSIEPVDYSTADWLAERDGGDLAIGQLARLYDLTILARPVLNASVPRIALLETVLFESGRPVLIVPPEAPKNLGHVVVLAWNGSAESARAITFAQPFLRHAKRVVVLTVEGGTVAGPVAVEVEHMLLRAGIPAEVSDVQTAERSIGEAILAEADQVGADLLIKGAYTHSRLRQMIFGGATKHILAEANLPVLMVH